MTDSAKHPEPIVEMRGIHKAFGAVKALVDVDLVLYPGEVLGLVGDNSAGKSTLMKILTGAYQRDSGDIRVAGREPSISAARTRAAMSASR
jgi:simple sugar transport system ATP-binding protein